MSANDRQVGGDHYRSPMQHWDFVWANNLDYFQGQITRYVTRWRNKDGLEDLYKAKHFLEKYIELVEARQKEGVDPEHTMSMSIGREERDAASVPARPDDWARDISSDLSRSNPVDGLRYDRS